MFCNSQKKFLYKYFHTEIPYEASKTDIIPILKMQKIKY